MRTLHPTTVRKLIGSLFVVFIAILAALMIGAKKNMTELRHLEGVKQELIQENLTLMQANKTLRSERTDLHTAEHVEHVARGQFGLIRPNEVIFVVEESKPLSKE